MRPEIATILEDGTYGQREMTNDEYEAYIETVTDSQPLMIGDTDGTE
jgi:hypothetical protein